MQVFVLSYLHITCTSRVVAWWVGGVTVVVWWVPSLVYVAWVSGHHHHGGGKWQVGAGRFASLQCCCLVPYGCGHCGRLKMHLCCYYWVLAALGEGSHILGCCCLYPPPAVVWGPHPKSCITTAFAGAGDSASGAQDLHLWALSCFPRTASRFQYVHLQVYRVWVSQVSCVLSSGTFVGLDV